MTSSQQPETETIQVTPALKSYLDALLERGLMEDDGQRLSPTGERLMRALHHFLTGGRISVSIEERGSASEVEDLDRMLDRMKEECPENARALGIQCF